MISGTHTIVDPGTVVVINWDAVLANFTVSGPSGFDYVAVEANILWEIVFDEVDKIAGVFGDIKFLYVTRFL